MTFVTSLRPKVRIGGSRWRHRAFTLLELLLVIGIIALLAGILLPAVNKTYQRAIALRTQADLQAISTGLEAYKADFGTYPVITGPNTGAAVLGKALLGPADEAHYYDATRTATPDLKNAPDVFSSSKTYQAGDVVIVGAAPTYASYTTGTPAPQMFVCVRNDTNGSLHSPTGMNTDSWWAFFIPYDGKDGNGIRTRLADVVDGAGLPHAAAGKVYGPYLDVERFKTNGPVILDRYGSPILYFPVNKAGVPTMLNGYVGRASYPRIITPAPGEPLSMINAQDNLGVFANDAVATAETPAELFVNVAITLGDFNVNGANDTVASAAVTVPEAPVPSLPFILWTAGPDKRFGPTGQRASMSFRRGDYFGDALHQSENQNTSAAIDDVTNFR